MSLIANLQQQYMPYYYKLFDLVVCSNAALPNVQNNELKEVPTQKSNLFISLEPDSTDTAIPANHLSVTPDKVELFIPDTGFFTITEGQSIVVKTRTEDLERIQLYLLGLAMSFALIQRGDFVLHANAITNGRQAFLVSAPSGYGKSTLTALFMQIGWKVLTDDLAVVRFIDGKPYAIPGMPRIKLWEEIVTKFDFSDNKLAPVMFRENKYNVSIEDMYMDAPQPISHIFVLTKEDLPSPCVKLTGASKLFTLMENRFRGTSSFRMNKEISQLKQCEQLAQYCPVYHLHRPEYTELSTLPRDLILKTLSLQENT